MANSKMTLPNDEQMFDPSTLHPLLRDLAAFVTNRLGDSRYDSAIPARSHGDCQNPPLFLLPTGEGDHSYAFVLTHQAISSHFPVYALPWSSTEDKKPQSMEEMAVRMIGLMRKVQPEGSFAIAGYSSGGILAYEIARRLISDKCPPYFVGLIDTYLTGLMKQPFNETESFLYCVCLKVKCLNDKTMWDSIKKMGLDEAVEEVRRTCASSKVTTDVEREKLVSKWKQVYHFQKLCEAYKADPLPLRVTLFKATEFVRLSEHRLNLGDKVEKFNDRYEKCFKMPKSGWEICNLGDTFDVIPIAGDHITMMEDLRNRTILGTKISQALSDALLSLKTEVEQ